MSDRVAELNALLSGTSITELTLTTPTETLTLRRAPPPLPLAGEGWGEGGAASGESDVPGPTTLTLSLSRQRERGALTSPCPGTLRLTHPVQQTPLARYGHFVQAGATVALVQAGPLLLHVTAPRAGRLGPPLLADGATVGYGTVLMRLEAE